MKKIAVLLVFTVMFGVYSPAFAERSWSDVAVDAGAGGVRADSRQIQRIL